MTVTEITRTMEGVEAPRAGTYELDPNHTTVGFVARHMMVTKVRGRFTDLSGAVHISEDPLDSSVEVEIQAASVDTRNGDRDQHLKSPDFFAVEDFPTIRFRSTKVEPKGDGRFAVTGDLTVKDVTREVVLDTTYEGGGQDPWGNARIGFSATTKVNREDWGLTWNQALETGGVLVSKEVTLEIEAQAVRQD